MGRYRTRPDDGTGRWLTMKEICALTDVSGGRGPALPPRGVGPEAPEDGPRQARPDLLQQRRPGHPARRAGEDGPVHLRLFATIPSFMEALEVINLRALVSLPPVGDPVWDEVDEVCLGHERCHIGCSYVIPPAGDDPAVAPSMPKDRRGDLLTPVGRIRSDLCALWGLDALIHEERHRVIKRDDDRAVIFTPHAIYLVPIPDCPDRPLSTDFKSYLRDWYPGVFLVAPKEAVLAHWSFQPDRARNTPQADEGTA